MGPISLLVKNWMGPNVQSGKTRWDQTSSLAKMAWDQMSMGPIVRLPSESGNVLISGKASQTNCQGIRSESKYEIVCSDLYPSPTLLNATVEGVSILAIKLQKMKNISY